MASSEELSDFLRAVERRAFKQTVYAVRDDHTALKCNNHFKGR